MGQQAAAGLGQLGEAPHVLEDGRARDRAAEAERVEGLVHGSGQVAGQGAHRAHPLPEGLERQGREARGQHLQVEVEPQPAAGQGFEERPAGRPRPPQLEEGVGGPRGERDEADVEGAVRGALDEGLAREHLGRGLLEVVEHALAALVEAEDTVPRPLLERGRLREAEDGRALLGDRGRVEVDDRVAGGDDDLAAAPRVLEEEAQLHVEDDRGQEGARGDRQRREELPLRRVAGEPAGSRPPRGSAGCAARRGTPPRRRPASRAAGGEPTACCPRCRPGPPPGRGPPRTPAPAGRAPARGGARGARGRPPPAAPRRP